MQVTLRQYMRKFEALYWKSKAEHFFIPAYMFFDFYIALGVKSKTFNKACDKNYIGLLPNFGHFESDSG